MKAVQAFEVLSDDKKRKDYDLELKQRALLKEVQAEAGFDGSFDEDSLRCTLFAITVTVLQSQAQDRPIFAASASIMIREVLLPTSSITLQYDF